MNDEPQRYPPSSSARYDMTDDSRLIVDIDRTRIQNKRASRVRTAVVAHYDRSLIELSPDGSNVIHLTPSQLDVQTRQSLRHGHHCDPHLLHVYRWDRTSYRQRRWPRTTQVTPPSPLWPYTPRATPGTFFFDQHLIIVHRGECGNRHAEDAASDSNCRLFTSEIVLLRCFTSRSGGNLNNIYGYNLFYVDSIRRQISCCCSRV